MTSTPGHAGFLLLASPALEDPNFRRSVVLMIDHDAEGAFGLVLNRPLDRLLGEVLESDQPLAAEVPLHSGGPVQTDMVQFVSSREGGGKTVLPGVIVGASLEDLIEATTQGAAVRAYAGYAGWGGGQLERETEEGSWIVAPAAARHVFSVEPAQLWATVLRELGGHYAWLALDDGSPQDN